MKPPLNAAVVAGSAVAQVTPAVPRHYHAHMIAAAHAMQGAYLVLYAEMPRERRPGRRLVGSAGDSQTVIPISAGRDLEDPLGGKLDRRHAVEQKVPLGRQVEDRP